MIGQAEPTPTTRAPPTGVGAEPSVCFVSLAAYAYFDPDAGASPGGAERQLSLVGTELADEFDVSFVVGDYGQPACERRDGVVLHRAYTPAAEASVPRRGAQLVALYRAMRRADADVYVFRGEPLRAAVTYGLARVLGRRMVYNLARDSQATASSEGPAGALYRRVLAGADGVVAQTPFQRRELRRSNGIDATVVPNGYPATESALPHEEREFVLSVGRIDRDQKRPHLFLELARRLPEEQFVLVGPRTDDDAYCDRIAREASELDNVAYPGVVDPEEVLEYYERAVALVNTASQEGFPNTFLEAWRVATPVLGLDVDPARYLDSDPGVCADGDLDRLVDLTADLADSVDRRRRLGDRARAHFEQTYRLSVVADRYATLLRRCLA